MENINKGLLTHIGSMNYIVQVWGNINSDEDITVQNYMPRKTLVCQLEVNDKEELIKSIKETQERMRVAINLFDSYLEGKIDYVYYWDLPLTV